jgi:hypothetical protein
VRGAGPTPDPVPAGAAGRAPRSGRRRPLLGLAAALVVAVVAAGPLRPGGVLPADGQAPFTLPASVVGRYQAVDISLEADDGDPAHSRHSLLRGRYA